MKVIAAQSMFIGSQRLARRAFTLVELMIVVLIVAILAAIVAPRFSGASQVAQASALRQDLSYIRQQLQVYRAQHQGVSPGYPGGDSGSSPTELDFVEQMTNPTSIDGTVGTVSSPTFRFGPYLAEIPLCPINGSSAVLVISNGSSMPGVPTSSSPYGWIYKPETLEFRAYVPDQDENGKYYYDY